MTDQQPSFRELRSEAEALGIVTTGNAKQTKTELATAITSARLNQALVERGGGR